MKIHIAPDDIIFNILEFLGRQNSKNLSKAIGRPHLYEIFYTKKENGFMLGNTENFTQKIISAPTQVGKTKFTISFIEKITGLVVFVIQNRKDQQNQTIARFLSNGIKIHKLSNKTDVNLLKTELKKEKRVVLSVLYNSSKIKILLKLSKELKGNEEYTAFMDEADVLSRSCDTGIYWKNHMNDMVVSGKTTVFYVSATHLNCLKYTNKVLELETPDNYRKITEFNEWNGSLSVISQETKILNKGEIILYSISGLLTQTSRAIQIVSDIKNTCCITYNSNGVVLYIYRHNRIYTNLSKFSLKDTLNNMKDCGMSIIIIGGNLINRGLSFCSDGDLGLTATVLFYERRSSKCSNPAAIVQKFGRITGTARPDLVSRRIYANPAFISAYRTYMGVS